MPLFKGKVPYEMKQFVAAAIVSHAEIEREDFRIIDVANNRLQEALKTKNVSGIYEDYSLVFDRLVILMNTLKPKQHGEDY